MMDLDFYNSSPNWRLYVEEAKQLGLDNGATHLIIVQSGDDPTEIGTWFYYADDRSGVYNSGLIEKRCETGGGIVRAVIELGETTHG